MITAFKIENFRLFTQLRIERLSRVNLIVGKNNSGKSALLEALLLYHSRFSLLIIIELLKNRMEDWDAKLSVQDASLADPMRHFFKNHEIPGIGSGLSLSSGNDKLLLESAAYIIQDFEDKDGSLVRKTKVLGSEDEVDGEGKRGLLVKDGNTPGTMIDLDGEIPSPVRLRRMFPDGGILKFISSRGITDEQAANMWDVVGLSDRGETVVSGLKLIEPAIERLAFIKSEERRIGRIPIAKLSCFNMPVPLKSLGDGMTRILHILLSLVACKKGEILVIDEFENGLHWSVQPNVWKLIFEIAKRLGVQVFASTHSRDCVAGFHEAWMENKEDGAFLRLMRGDGQPPVQEYDLELLADSLDAETEVR